MMGCIPPLNIQYFSFLDHYKTFLDIARDLDLETSPQAVDLEFVMNTVWESKLNEAALLQKCEVQHHCLLHLSPHLLFTTGR